MSMILLSAIYPERCSRPVRRGQLKPGSLRPPSGWCKRLDECRRSWRLTFNIGHTRFILCW